jgi:Fe-S-cluster containining protein
MILDKKLTIKSEDLCKSCGLCCKGVLHDHVGIQDSLEVNILLKNNISITKLPGKDESSFNLPCSAHNGVCSIYKDRPSQCKKYECNLLTKYKGNQLTFDECSTIIIEIKNVLKKIKIELSNTNYADIYKNNIINSSDRFQTNTELTLKLAGSKYKKLFLLIGVVGHLKKKHFTDNCNFSYGKKHFQRLLQYIESGNFN